jgi:hypothetical protein
MLACVLVGAVLLAGFPGSSPQQPRLTPVVDSPSPSAAEKTGVAAIEEKLAADRAAEAVWLKRVALALNGEPGPDLTPLQQEVAAVLRLRGERLAAQDPSWPDPQVDALLALMLIDPRRFTHDSDFRANVTPILRDALPASVPVEARRRMARQLGSLEFGPSERLLVAWGLAPRTSRDREVLFGSWPANPGSTAAIRASIYSLPSRFFRYEDAAAFLRGVHEIAPQRQLVVVSDAPLIEDLRSLTDELPLHLIDSYARRYTPWPRDPFVVVNDPSGSVRLLVRPNAQARREGDVSMAREIVHGLPRELDADWGEVEWSAAPIPFHGGHTLATPGVTWASVHTLLPRIVEIMGEYPTPSGLQHPWARGRFIAATKAAREEFEVVFGQPVRFVHPLPSLEDAEPLDFDTMLIGGGTSDLDSLITILPEVDGRVTALVGDFGLGDSEIGAAPSTDLDAFAHTYHLELAGEQLREAMLRQQPTPTNALIDSFLDLAAEHLRSEGLDVKRLPLLHVPESLVEEEFRLARDGFLVTWTNVVFEATDGATFAEGFAGGLPGVDASVRETYASAGIELRLAPTLALSVMRDGGYRCASNHVR